MSISHTPGQTVYTDDGRLGIYVGAIADGPHLIKPIFEDYGYDGESVERWEGGIQEVSRVFAEPPREKLHEEIAALNSQVSELTKKVQALRTEEHNFTREQQKREALRAKEAQFATLDLFLEKKVTHLVYPGNSAVHYRPFEQAIKQDEERHYSELRLIALFGDTKGKLDWRINSYRDGSGNWQGIIPCQSEDEARQTALSLTTANLEAQLAEALRADLEPNQLHWKRKAVVDTVNGMRRFGYPIPDEALAMVADVERISAEGLVKLRREELNKAEAALAAISKATSRQPEGER